MTTKQIEDVFEQRDEYLLDATENGRSECCGARVLTGICMDCKEHTSVVTED